LKNSGIEELRFCEGQLRRHSRTSALFREKYNNRIKVLEELLEIAPAELGKKRKKAS
jgi:hypothetical protein